VSATGGGRAFVRSGLGGDGSARFLRSLSSPIISARVRDLSVLAANAVVSTWGSWTASAGTQPTYITGTDGKYEVAFSGALTQYLDAGPRVCNFATNEGFTIVLYFKFTSTDGNQVLFNCEQGGALIRIRRAGFTDPRIYFQGGNPSNTWTGSYTGGPWFTGTVWQTNVWNVAVYRYRRVNGTGFLQYIHNNVLNAELNMGASAFENAAYTTPRLGSSTFTGSMRFAAMWDRALSDAELTGLYTSLTT
jgi:hypothetical protein